MEMWTEKDGVPVEAPRKGKTPVGMVDTPKNSDWIRQYNQGVIAIDEGWPSSEIPQRFRTG